MYLQVSRSGSLVVVKLPTVLDRYYTFSIDMTNETTAELLARDMDQRIDAAMKAARQTSYEQGWADAKAKRAKRDYHSTWLEVK